MFLPQLAVLGCVSGGSVVLAVAVDMDTPSTIQENNMYMRSTLAAVIGLLL